MKSSLWNKINSALNNLKKISLFRLLYKIPYVPSIYHFLLAFFGAVIYHFPGRKMVIIGITGTKGKTTVTEIINAILEKAEKKTALLSSLRIKIARHSEKNLLGNSMPGHFFVQNFLQRAERERCTHAIIEVTSQGVVFSRHRFIKWGIAGLTNLAPEHIESHGSFEKYRNAKLSFLKLAERSGASIFLNIKDKHYDFFSKKIKEKNIKTFSRALFDKHPVINPLIKGDFYKDNMAISLEIARFLGISDEVSYEAFSDFKGVSGRMDFVQKTPFVVIVDYAHTPDSLESIYITAKTEYMKKNGHLIGVFGSAGGGRDKWKRPAMGKVASEHCSFIILTDEDPYEESPENILKEIRSGISTNFSQDHIYEIIDRKEAIKKAISLAKEGDVIVFSGKGSESFIHIKDKKKIPWNEREIVRGLLS